MAGNGGDDAGASGGTGAANGGTSSPGAGGGASAGAAGGMLAANGGGMGSGGAHPSGGTGSDTDGGSQDTGGTGSGGAGAGGKGSGGAGYGGTGSGGSTSTTRWCDGQKDVLFCEDFDGFSTIDDLFNTWTSVSTSGGVFSFDTSAGVPSAPNALRVRTTAPYSVSTLAIKRLPAFAAKPSKIRVEFDFGSTPQT